MAKRKWRIVGIKQPGLVDIFPFGEVRLYDLDDAMLEKIKNETNCPYIQPEIDAPAPTKSITTKTTKAE